MKNSKWLPLGIGMSVIVLTAALLMSIKGMQTLGKPGVTVLPVPSYDVKGKVARKESVGLPEKLPGATCITGPISKAELDELPKDTTFGRRIYQLADGFEWMASVVLMGNDRSSIHQPEFCLVGQGWSIDTNEEVTVRMEKPYCYDLRATRLTVSRLVRDQGQNQIQRGIYVYWFVTEGKLSTGQGERMWSIAKSLIFKHTLERWAYVTYFAVCQPGQENVTFERLAKQINLSVPEFQTTAGTPITLAQSH